jgi:glycerol kinase
MSEPLILVLDEGTTSTRAVLFTAAGEPCGTAQRELTQHYPRPGWVEHDAGEIWHRTFECAIEMVALAEGAGHVAAIGITNQRETVVAWDKRTGEPLARALVWQDRRTADFCAALRDAGHEDAVRARTGLLLDPYFSATKMRWLLDNEPAVADAARGGHLAFGTIESWLAYKLTGAHLSDAGNASRTLLLALDGGDWHPELCALFGVPREALPELTDSAGSFGATTLFGAPIPICGLAGDQQAATIGQGCLRPGDTKATYGTGAFVLSNQGTRLPRSHHRLLGTVLHQLGGERHYALEGSVFVAGSFVKWLRDALGFIESAAETEALARSVEDSGGVVVVPALSGLGAPHWRPEARGLITGLSFATQKAHIVRAALGAMAHQTHDLAAAFAADAAPWSVLKVDGGMAANDWMAQDIADIVGLEVIRPDFVETTALGAAMLAAVGAGIHPSLEAAAEAMIGPEKRFVPAMKAEARERRIAAWNEALAKV